MTAMPKFIDVHPMQPFTADQLKKLQNAAPDEFGVTHHDILFSEKENKVYCVLDAPNSEAIHKHHAKAAITCDWVHEVKSTRT
jgi:1-aminocyclopropane-1-carboxylate deaminase/D-cysteine desulfhydrase-like pyridoxal-dependent ACC family enzyme